MTERTGPPHEPRPAPEEARAGATAAGPGARGQAGRRPSRFAERNLLRNPLPVAAAAITVLLITLALLSARLSAGSDPALHLGSSQSVVASSSQGARTIVRTTASGRTITETVGPGTASATRREAPAGALSTRTSGAGREQADD